MVFDFRCISNQLILIEIEFYQQRWKFSILQLVTKKNLQSHAFEDDCQAVAACLWGFYTFTASFMMQQNEGKHDRIEGIKSEFIEDLFIFDTEQTSNKAVLFKET